MKKTKLLTLALASVMGLSAFALASCGEKDPGGKTDPDDPTPVAETGFLKDESIKGKIIAGYTFENGGAAIDPYTGEAISKLDVRVTDEAGVVSQGISGSKALESGTAGIKLPKMGDTMDEDTGVSFTYLNYGTGDGYSDWNQLLTSDFLTLNYGNITFSGGSAYPSICSELGYGAFAKAALEEAETAGLTKQELSSVKAPNVYYGYNAGCVEGKTDTQTNYRAAALYNDMVDNWQVMTVTVTTDNITFYRNGSMSYRYARSIFEGANKSNGEFFLADLVDYEEEGDSAVYMFTGAGGVVDNLIIGQALSAKEVVALYNDLAASAGKSTKTEDEAILLDPDASTKLDAEAVAFNNAVATRTAAIGAKFDEAVAAATALNTVGEADCSTAWWTAFQSATFEDGSNTMSITYLQKTAEGGNWHGTSTVLLGAEAAELVVVRTDAYGWGDYYATTTNTNNFDWATMKNVVNGATIVETITKNDDGTITIRYDITPMDAGETYEGTATTKLSDGSDYEATSSFTVAESYFIEYVVTGAPTDSLSVKLALDSAQIVVTGITGGALAE